VLALPSHPLSGQLPADLEAAPPPHARSLWQPPPGRDPAAAPWPAPPLARLQPPGRCHPRRAGNLLVGGIPDEPDIGRSSGAGLPKTGAGQQRGDRAWRWRRRPGRHPGDGGTRRRRGTARRRVTGVGNFFLTIFLSKQGRTNVWEENKVVGVFCKKKSVIKFSVATST
jgi:hypothetical protein